MSSPLPSRFSVSLNDRRVRAGVIKFVIGLGGPRTIQLVTFSSVVNLNKSEFSPF